jgi:hypothetical protein
MAVSAQHFASCDLEPKTANRSPGANHFGDVARFGCRIQPIEFQNNRILFSTTRTWMVNQKRKCEISSSLSHFGFSGPIPLKIRRLHPTVMLRRPLTAARPAPRAQRHPGRILERELLAIDLPSCPPVPGGVQNHNALEFLFAGG